LFIAALVAGFFGLVHPQVVLAARFPVVGSGDIHFRLDQASFRSGAGTTESEFYLEIDHNELAFRKEGDRNRAKIELRLEFFGAGQKLDTKTYPLDIWEGKSEDGPPALNTQVLNTQVIQLRLAPPAESDSVHAWVEDRNARKRGLFHFFTQDRRAGQAGAQLAVRRFPEGELSISDIEFARSASAKGEEPTFVKSGVNLPLEVEPNPGRVYGALTRVGIVYLEVYDLTEPAGEDRRKYELEYRLRDLEGNELRSWKHKLTSHASTWVDTTSFDLTGVGAGTYLLGVVVKQEEGAGRAAVEAPFDVLWAASNWVRWVLETEAIIPFLMQGEEQDRFLALGPGAKERQLEAFWGAHDPTPGPGNNTREEFEQRISYANANFSTNLEPGMRTDRGRTYVKYGEADEIRREIIPVQGNDLNAALNELDRGTGGDLRGARAIKPEDGRAFEVWIYDYRGQELFPSKQISTGIGRQFVFVDDLGIGEFRLIRSSEQSEF
jgi:GWxTD domain-containing protein